MQVRAATPDIHAVIDRAAAGHKPAGLVASSLAGDQHTAVAAADQSCPAALAVTFTATADIVYTGSQ